jgi:hypothetical protein
VLDPRTGQLLREHLRQERGRHRIPNEDRPAHAPRSTLQLLARCEKAGPHIGTLCQLMYRQQNVVPSAAFKASSAWPRVAEPR